MDPKLVSGRDCGECTFCCINLRIEVSNLKKLAGTPCPHLIYKKGCGIYNDRPDVCRNWYCAWRHIESIGEEGRPDKSNLLLRLTEDGLIVEALKAPYIDLTSNLALGIIGGGIVAGITMYISVPTKDGYCNSKLKLSEKLKSIVESRDGDKMRSAMIESIRIASNLETDPIEPLK